MTKLFDDACREGSLNSLKKKWLQLHLPLDERDFKKVIGCSFKVYKYQLNYYKEIA